MKTLLLFVSAGVFGLALAGGLAYSLAAYSETVPEENQMIEKPLMQSVVVDRPVCNVVGELYIDKRWEVYCWKLELEKGCSLPAETVKSIYATAEFIAQDCVRLQR